MPDIRTHSNGVVYADWPLAEYGRAFDVTPDLNNFGHNYASRGYVNDNVARMREWFGGLHDVNAAQELFTGGWREGAERLQKVCDELNPPAARSRKRVRRWCDDGDELSIDRAMRGQWENAWQTTRRQWSSGTSHVDIYTAVGGNCYQSSDELFWQGAVCAVVADRLENAGYAVRIVGINSTLHSARRGSAHVATTIKESHEPVRIDSLAAVLCHAGVFRTLGIRAMMNFPFTVGMECGHHRGWSEMAGPLKGCGELTEGALILNNCFNRGAAIAEIKRALNSVGGSDE